MAKPSRKKRRASPVEVPANIVAKEGKVGRPSYADKARKEGLFDYITSTILDVVSNNPEITFQDLYKVLNSEYPEVFQKEEQYSRNIRSLLENVPEWWGAYKFNKNKEINFGMFKTSRVFYKPDAKDKDIIRAYDVLMKYEMQNKEIEASGNDKRTATVTVEW